MLEQLHVVLVVFAIKSLDGNPSSPPEECSPVVADRDRARLTLRQESIHSKPIRGTVRATAGNNNVAVSSPTLTFPRLYKPAPKTSNRSQVPKSSPKGSMPFLAQPPSHLFTLSSSPHLKPLLPPLAPSSKPPTDSYSSSQ